MTSLFKNKFTAPLKRHAADVKSSQQQHFQQEQGGKTQGSNRSVDTWTTGK